MSPLDPSAGMRIAKACIFGPVASLTPRQLRFVYIGLMPDSTVSA